ncbi:MAG: uracil-DNA glycosylase [Dehalococcoidia bacterium]|nr:uracil-DNA glycosylase [Dehalococcoidia bacterium]
MTLLDSLTREIENCHDCELAQLRTRVVPGEGPQNSTVLFIGEAPGFNEDKQGRPFVGAAGQFLQELLASAGLKREQVFIANVVKCRPPDNRDPLPDEIQSCKKWLDRQIEIIRPKMIVTLGRYSMARYFPGETIGKIHGNPRKVNGVMCFPMYHPAAALHQGGLRQTLKDDMAKIPQTLEQVLKEEKPPEPKPKQLGMF